MNKNKNKIIWWEDFFQGHSCTFKNNQHLSLLYFSSLSLIPNNTSNLLYFSHLSLFPYSLSPLSLFLFSSHNQTHHYSILFFILPFSHLHFPCLSLSDHSSPFLFLYTEIIPIFLLSIFRYFFQLTFTLSNTMFGWREKGKRELGTRENEEK